MQSKVASFFCQHTQVSEPGAVVDVWNCCHDGGSKICKHPEKNYNQQWGFSPTKDQQTGHVQVFTPSRKPGLCLTATSTLGVTLQPCSATNAKMQEWISSSKSAPLLRLASNSSLCLSSVSAPRPPPPPPNAITRACLQANTTHLPFCDTTLSISARARDLVGRMTLEEKLVQLIGGIGGGVTPATPRLGVMPRNAIL